MGDIIWEFQMLFLYEYNYLSLNGCSYSDKTNSHWTVVGAYHIPHATLYPKLKLVPVVNLNSKVKNKYNVTKVKH